MNERKQKYDILDILKYILSIFVVAIHTSLFPKILYPWLRIAVPLFFIMTSYFLFLKIKSNEKSKKEIILNYVKRNLTLYFFWFICLLPITLYIRNYFKEGFLSGIILFIKSFLFDSTFVASWYIMASIIGVLIVIYLSRFFRNKTLLFISLLIYILVVLRSSYYNLFINNSFINNLVNLYESVFSYSPQSFPAALFWIVCGKCFAEYKFTLESKKLLNIILIVISALLLYIEWLFVFKKYSICNSDCYFGLVPFCILLFMYIKNIKVNIPNSNIYRKMSTIIYAVHGSLNPIVRRFLEYNFGEIVNLYNFIITLSISLLICLIIFKLENLKCFKWLKYSH